MELLTDPKFDFLGRRNFFMGLSALGIAASIGFLAFRGLNLGIEFLGGTEVVLRFREAPEEEEIRARLDRENLADAQIQRLGRPEDREVLIRTGLLPGGEEEGGETSRRLTDALRPPEERERTARGDLDLNAAGADAIALWLARRSDPAAAGPTAEAESAAAAIARLREQRGGIFTDPAGALELPEVSPEWGSALAADAFAGEFVVREVGFIGPSAGQELRLKTYWAVAGAMAGILIYIWLRFRFFWGFAAVAAIVHDVLITLGGMSVTQKEFSLPVVAAVLTVIGFSLNDTIVIFDRIRENLRTARVRDLAALLNQSINQTLSRTLLTSLTVLFVVITLNLFGGTKMNSLSFALLIGLFAGIYSTVFIASPLLLIWERTLGRRL
ncbi:MAG: protein translocase subunit SecF [Acidobacteria bacterium]|nr:protein translocase subunit SecF [Acidobacteriota bacterium]